MPFLVAIKIQGGTCIYINHIQMKGRSGVFVVVSIVFVLLFVIGFLLVKIHFYKNENRKLLLQNDSVMSANIELKDSIDSISIPVSNDKRKFKTISTK